jgi:hypothetical protein
MKPVNRADITDLEDIPNIGPSLADKLRRIGVSFPQDLLGKDPYAMCEDLCHATGVRHDPCVIDVFIAAIRFMAGEASKPWWKYTAERKRRLAGKADFRITPTSGCRTSFQDRSDGTSLSHP